MTLNLVGYVSGLAQTGSTINVTLPGSTAAGDLCVGTAISVGPGNTSTPTGFTLLDGPTAGDSNEVRGFYRVMTAGDISNGFVTMPGDPGFNGTAYSLWVWHSTGGTPTIDGHNSRQASDGASPTICDAAQITTASDGSAVCVSLAGRGGTPAPSVWSSTPGGITTDQNAMPSSAGLNAIYAYHFTQTSAGLTPSQSASLDSANAREVSATIGVADVVVVSGALVARYAPDFRTRRRLAYRIVDTGQTGAGRMAVTLGSFTMAGVGAQNSAVRGSVWTKTLTGAGGAETWTSASAVEVAAAYVVLHGATALDQTATTSGIADFGDSPSVTTTANDEMVLWGHFRDAAAITVTPGTGTTVGPVQSSATATRTSVAVNDQTQTTAGVSGARRFAGAAANSWAAATVSITGIPGGSITGTMAVTLAPFVMAASGTSAPPTITGTIAVTLAAFVMAATGNVTIGGTAPTLVGDLTSSPYLPEANSSPRWD